MLCDYTKSYTVQLKWVDFLVYEIYLNTSVLKTQRQTLMCMKPIQDKISEHFGEKLCIFMFILNTKKSNETKISEETLSDEGLS